MGGSPRGSSGGQPSGGHTGQSDLLSETERHQGEDSGQSEDHLRRGRVGRVGSHWTLWLIDPALSTRLAAIPSSASEERFGSIRLDSARFGSG